MSFLTFTEVGKDNSSQTYKLVLVGNKKGEPLGWVSFFPLWKKYVFSTCHKDVAFDVKCLKEVIEFMETLK